MDKYKKTSGLNYLSENSYKGDGSPGMVMGIASDARGDTNTNEAQKPTTSSKHSGERDLKKYDPAHGHTKPEGGKPQVCSQCKGEGCNTCQDTGEVISKKRNDPEVDESVDGYPYTKRMSVEDIEYYVEWLRDLRDEGSENMFGAPRILRQEFGLSRDQAQEVFDAYTASFQELDEIMNLAGMKDLDAIDEARRKVRHDDEDDFDDDDEKPEDPDADKVPHILMQLKKAQDVEGDHHIKFIDGQKHKLPIADINLFMDKYMDMKPQDREMMQKVAVMSKEQFDTILTFFQPKHGKLEKSIYEDGQMISESQFDEAAGEKDACYHKVKSRYKVWPSAYASGALVKCRKAGASNWGEGGKKK
jgi:hypothetical protein